MTDAIYDEGEHTKTVFAHFGRAYYTANVFETGLANAILQLEFLTVVSDRIRREGRKTFDQRRYEADFDDFMERQHAQTLGTLLKRVRGLVALPAHLQTLVDEALAKRNCLAHHYFRERAEKFASRRGRDRMIEELDAAMAVFDAANTALEAFLEPHRSSFDLTKERLDARVVEYLKSLRDED